MLNKIIFSIFNIFFAFIASSQTIFISEDTIKFDDYYIVKECIWMSDSVNNTYDGSFVCFNQVFSNNHILIKQSSICEPYGKLGIEKTIFQSGAIKKIEVFLWKQQVGPYFEFYPSGKLKIFGQYKFIDCYSDLGFHYDTLTSTYSDTIRVNFVPVKHGNWLYFNEDSYIETHEIWKDNMLLNRLNYNKNKRKLNTIYY